MEHKVDTRHLQAEKEQIAVRLRNMSIGSPNGLPEQIYQDSTTQQTIIAAAHSVPDYYGLYGGAGLGAQVGYTQNPLDYADAGGVIPRNAVPKARKRDVNFVNVDLASAATSGVVRRQPSRNDALRDEMVNDIERFLGRQESLRSSSLDQIASALQNLFAKQVALAKKGTPMLPLGVIPEEGSVVPQRIHLEAPVIDVTADEDEDDGHFINLSVIDSQDRRLMLTEIEKFMSPSDHGLTGVSSLQEYEMTVRHIADRQKDHFTKGTPAPVRERSMSDADVFAETMADVAMMSDDELREHEPAGEDWDVLGRKDLFQRVVRLILDSSSTQS